MCEELKEFKNTVTSLGRSNKNRKALSTEENVRMLTSAIGSIAEKIIKDNKDIMEFYSGAQFSRDEKKGKAVLRGMLDNINRFVGALNDDLKDLKEIFKK